MNKERLENLIVALNDAQKFDMGKYAHHCGTPACVLGHYAARTDLQDAFVLEGGDLMHVDGDELNDYAHPEVCLHFDISPSQASMLFSEHGCDFASTAREAQAYIRSFIDHEGYDASTLLALNQALKSENSLLRGRIDLLQAQLSRFM